MRHVIAAVLTLSSLPAFAEVLAVAQSGDGASIVLHDDAGPCVGGAMLAEHISPKGDKVRGCWVAASGNVNVSFFDGERGTIPVLLLKKPTRS